MQTAIGYQANRSINVSETRWIRILQWLAVIACAWTVPAFADTVTATLTAGAHPSAVATNPVTNKIYVANRNTANVTVIDGATNVTSSVHAGTSPFAVAVNPVTNKIYVANFTSNNVTVIDGATNVPTTVAAGTNPLAIAVNPVTNKIYVANNGSNNVTVIDGATNIPTTVAAGTNPQAIAVNPVTNKIYVANNGSDNVTVIDGATNIPTTVAAGSFPSAVAVNPLTNKIYVTNYGSNNVSAIDGASNAVTTLAAGTNPNAVAVNPVTNKIYVANSVSANVTVIDESVPQPIPLGTTITTALSGNSASFNFSITNAFAPIAPPTTAVYYQLDTRQGPWLAATGSGPYAGASGALSPGVHVVYAFAVDGEDGTSANVSSPLIGQISASAFVVPVYAVTYAPGGGAGSLPTQANVGAGAAFTLASGAGLSRVGYTFNGWNDGTTTYAAGAAYTMGAANVTLTAQWSPTMQTVTYAAGGGTGTLPTQANVATGGTFTVASGAGLARPGYTFVGWNDGTSTYLAGATYTMGAANVILTARWTATSQSVTYALGGGSGTLPTQANVATGGTFQVASGAGLTRAGYNFAGWSDGTATYAAGATYTIGASNVTLTAQWVPTSYTAPSATGTGMITASFTGSNLGDGCGFSLAEYIPVTGHAHSPPAGTAPVSLVFDHGLFNFTVTHCAPGSTLNFTITYPQPLPKGTQYWKYGPTASNQTPHWYAIPSTVNGSTITFSIADGGVGDDDLAQNGTIVDQGGPAIPAPPAAIPSLSDWGRVALVAILTLLGLAGIARRRA